jgi:nucleoside diphosphate kinase
MFSEEQLRWTSHHRIRRPPQQGAYPPLKAFMTSGPLIALVLEGDEAIEVVRT